MLIESFRKCIWWYVQWSFNCFVLHITWAHTHPQTKHAIFGKRKIIPPSLSSLPIRSSFSSQSHLLVQLKLPYTLPWFRHLKWQRSISPQFWKLEALSFCLIWLLVKVFFLVVNSGHRFACSNDLCFMRTKSMSRWEGDRQSSVSPYKDTVTATMKVIPASSYHLIHFPPKCVFCKYHHSRA